jgi:WD40 repeat protein
LWDATTGQEIASFDVEEQNSIRTPVFSTDGKRLVVASKSFASTTPTKHLLLLDGTTGRLVKKRTFGDKATIRQPVFSPDGKWVAVITQEAQEWERSEAQDAVLPQPRIQLIDSATGEVKETMIAPPGIAVSLGFSPDGKTLASSGDGRVLLWDMTAPPGSSH